MREREELSKYERGLLGNPEKSEQRFINKIFDFKRNNSL
jgi:hypothetical protein